MTELLVRGSEGERGGGAAWSHGRTRPGRRPLPEGPSARDARSRRRTPTGPTTAAPGGVG
ncbi:hypothetical protein FTX61_06910 [Nitriliruptoraceae bacterium ZYF776]|nr:hypothetical protein [Profundirhabdus halotolerans]